MAVLIGAQLTRNDGTGKAVVVTQAGSTLTGYVYFSTEEDIQAKSLIASIVGEERAQVTYEETVQGVPEKIGGFSIRHIQNIDHNIPGVPKVEGTALKYDRTVKAARPILQINIPIDQSELFRGDQIPAGKYKFPFEVELPAMIPGTMSAVATNGHCSIKYFVHTELKGAQNWLMSKLSSKFKSKHEFTVASKPLYKKHEVPCFKEPITTPVTACCHTKGYMTYGAKVDDTFLERGQRVSVQMSCVNNTSTEVLSTTALMAETVTWTVDGHSAWQYRTLSQADFGCFESRGKKRGMGASNFDEVMKDIERRAHSGTISLSQDTYDAYAGQIIQTNHAIRIAIVTKGCCVADPGIEIPIKVCSPSDNDLESIRPTTAAAAAAMAAAEPEIEVPAWADESSNGGKTEDVTSVSPTFVPDYNIMVGGTDVVVQQGDDTEPEIDLTAVSGGDNPYGDGDDNFGICIPKPPPPSFANLLDELKLSVSDLGVIAKKSTSDEWRTLVFSKLSPLEFQQILKLVDIGFDQLPVAEILAEMLGNLFTCHYVVMALRATKADWNRTNMVQGLMEDCVDLQTHHDVIRQELSEWEQTVTANAFEAALAKKKQVSE